MHWTVHLEGGPRRVNHAAVLLGEHVYSFGGYCSNESPPADAPIDIHVLNSVSYRWQRVYAVNEKRQEVQPATRMADDDSREGDEIESDYSDAGSEIGEEEEEDEAMEEDDDVVRVHNRNMMEDFNRGDVPYQRYGHTVVAFKDKAYLWGGRNDEFGASSTLHCFDPVTRTWSAVPVTGHTPPARDGHSALVYDDKMYLFGGFEEEMQRFSQETYVFDFQTGFWSEMITVGSRPKWRDFHTAVAIHGKMYIFGGRSDQHGEFHSTKDEYDDILRVLDLKTRKWDALITSGDRPCGRRSHSAWVFRDRMFIFGGYLGTENKHYNDLHSFDPQTCHWEKLKPFGMPPCVRRRQCTVEKDGKVFLFGGTMPMNPQSGTTGNQAAANGAQPTLSDLADLFVLDFSPSLYNLAAKVVINSNIVSRYRYALPRCVVSDLECMTTNNKVAPLSHPIRGAMG